MSKPFQLIYEQFNISEPVEILQESTYSTGEKKLKFKAKLQEANVVNNNGRIYSAEVLQEIVRQLAPKANERKLVGELDHPTPQGGPREALKRSSTMSLQEACVLYTKLEFDGKFIIAECETLSNSKGMDLYYLLKDKVGIGFSLRAFGNSRKRPDGVVEVLLEGLKALTFDVVGNPSHSNAVIYEVIQESDNITNLGVDGNSGESIDRMIQNLKQYKNEVIPVNLISENEDLTMVNSCTGEKLCGCPINGTCLEGSIQESIDYLLDMKFNQLKSNNTLKKFSLKL